jgi:hypothetical protein
MAPERTVQWGLQDLLFFGDAGNRISNNGHLLRLDAATDGERLQTGSIQANKERTTKRIQSIVENALKTSAVLSQKKVPAHITSNENSTVITVSGAEDRPLVSVSLLFRVSSGAFHSVEIQILNSQPDIANVAQALASELQRQLALNLPLVSVAVMEGLQEKLPEPGTPRSFVGAALKQSEGRNRITPADLPSIQIGTVVVENGVVVRQEGNVTDALRAKIQEALTLETRFASQLGRVLPDSFTIHVVLDQGELVNIISGQNGIYLDSDSEHVSAATLLLALRHDSIEHPQVGDVARVEQQAVVQSIKDFLILESLSEVREAFLRDFAASAPLVANGSQWTNLVDQFRPFSNDGVLNEHAAGFNDAVRNYVHPFVRTFYAVRETKESLRSVRRGLQERFLGMRYRFVAGEENPNAELAYYQLQARLMRHAEGASVIMTREFYNQFQSFLMQWEGLRKLHEQIEGRKVVVVDSKSFEDVVRAQVDRVGAERVAVMGTPDELKRVPFIIPELQLQLDPKMSAFDQFQLGLGLDPYTTLFGLALGEVNEGSALVQNLKLLQNGQGVVVAANISRFIDRKLAEMAYQAPIREAA